MTFETIINPEWTGWIVAWVIPELDGLRSNQEPKIQVTGSQKLVVKLDSIAVWTKQVKHNHEKVIQILEKGIVAVVEFDNKKKGGVTLLKYVP